MYYVFTKHTIKLTRKNMQMYEVLALLMTKKLEQKNFEVQSWLIPIISSEYGEEQSTDLYVQKLKNIHLKFLYKKQ